LIYEALKGIRAGVGGQAGCIWPVEWAGRAGKVGRQARY